MIAPSRPTKTVGSGKAPDRRPDQPPQGSDTRHGRPQQSDLGGDMILVPETPPRARARRGPDRLRDAIAPRSCRRLRRLAFARSRAAERWPGQREWTPGGAKDGRETAERRSCRSRRRSGPRPECRRCWAAAAGTRSAGARGPAGLARVEAAPTPRSRPGRTAACPGSLPGSRSPASGCDRRPGWKRRLRTPEPWRPRVYRRRAIR